MRFSLQKRVGQIKQKGCGKCAAAQKVQDRKDLSRVYRRTTKRQGTSGNEFADADEELSDIHAVRSFLEIAYLSSFK